jgi:hypothetical protein
MSAAESNTPQSKVRQLKIEAAGDPWKGCIKPRIRLTGRWLEKAGFKPDSHVQVCAVSPGVLELRSVQLEHSADDCPF